MAASGDNQATNNNLTVRGLLYVHNSGPYTVFRLKKPAQWNPKKTPRKSPQKNTFMHFFSHKKISQKITNKANVWHKIIDFGKQILVLEENCKFMQMIPGKSTFLIYFYLESSR